MLGAFNYPLFNLKYLCFSLKAKDINIVKLPNILEKGWSSVEE